MNAAKGKIQVNVACRKSKGNTGKCIMQEVKGEIQINVACRKSRGIQVNVACRESKGRDW